MSFDSNDTAGRSTGRSATAFAALLAVSLLTACAPSDASSPPEVKATLEALEIPQDLRDGEALYDANCSQCHGVRATGSETGPALVDRVYRPAHHADMSFLLAVSQGVRAHHWRFGDMPPIPQVSPREAGRITAYVRFLQEAVGVE